MYAKGDKIVYPLYGAGVIEDIEKKEIDGELQIYYVLTIPVGNLKIMISAAKAESLHVRYIHSCDEIRGLISCAAEIEMPDNWNQRYKENMERMKTGELPQVALVFFNLLLRERERGLSTAEKKMMTTTKQIILSELILSLDIDKDAAEQFLDDTFK
ncbi:MAG: CarD family transcriptional regulator [Defluviitaleaceae bacterium]|nr:CarD family transcriptional regulator [Defluviitaleaceae bacterium]MCL2261871.1 CarD family transcriptional regulator [Defluviitaleaceae bacterium]